MRLLHVADIALGNLNYRKLVRVANGGHDLIDLDRQASLDQAVGCALLHDVDAVLVAGGLLDGRARVEQYAPRLARRMAQLAAADIACIVYDPEDRLGALELPDGVLLLGDEGSVSVGGVTFTALDNVDASSAADGPVVAVGHGKVDGIGGNATHDRELDDRRVVACAEHATYVALGGMLECQPLTPNAWFCGAACGMYGYHPGDPGAMIVQLGVATRKVLDLVHVRWPSRRRVSMTIDAGGMRAETLADALHRRVAEVCMQVDAPAMDLDDEHPLARLYGGTSDRNGVGWWSRPLVDVSVRHAECSLGEVFAASPMLYHVLHHGEHVYMRIRWQREGDERPVEWKHAPVRVAP